MYAATATAPAAASPAPYATSGIPPAACTGEVACAWSLPHHPESAGTARRIARALLDVWGTDVDTADVVLLVVSELVTNALKHALPPVTLHLEQRTQSGALHIEVDDGGPTPEDRARAAGRDPEEHGRGSGIVALLATAHGERVLPRGAAHWADLPIAV
ncbi:ATP-binding protein [Streptomyces lydicus]|uniref:ATP-binding protein n=1 Tax=Streptomyces lydicus TaxID=47763 RepID=A0A3Q9KAS2_9ACTN|nr:ATP-binding protein [Streptomyces lydicus]AZS75765.1 ATP-binding protein [Streptomyces lydicus]